MVQGALGARGGGGGEGHDWIGRRRLMVLRAVVVRYRLRNTEVVGGGWRGVRRRLMEPALNCGVGALEVGRSAAWRLVEPALDVGVGPLGAPTPCRIVACVHQSSIKRRFPK